MLDLLDLFEKELFSDLLALTNIGKRISGNNEVIINFRGNCVYSDLKFIYLPKKYKKDIKSAQGLVAHEAGHIGYGSFELAFIKLIEMLSKKYNLIPYFVKNVVNIVEDVRIDNINKKKFPGFYRNLRLLTKKIMPQIKKRMRQYQDILIYLQLYMEDYKDFQKKPEFRTINISDSDWKGFEIAKKFLNKSVTPSTSIITSDQLCKILKKYMTNANLDDLQKQQRSSVDRSNPLNKIQDFARDKRKREKSKLDKISEDLIDILKNIDLKSDDIEDLSKIFDGIKKKKDIYKKLEKNEKLKIIHEIITKGKENDLKKIKGEGLNNSHDKSEQHIKELLKERTVKFDQKKNQKNSNKKLLFEDLMKLILDADDAMRKRLICIEKGDSVLKLTKSTIKRKTIETKIEYEKMVPINYTYRQIKTKYSGIIKKMKMIFSNLKNQAGIDTFQKKGRLNSKFIKAVTSEYKFKQCFTRKIQNKELKILILVDISGSMMGIKLRSAKTAMIMLCEALGDLAKTKIVLFTGKRDARNIIMKNFDENLNPKNIDKFGCHRMEKENLDGISIKYEASKLKNNEIIIVISDGLPAAEGNYGLFDAIPDIQKVRKRFKVFAFSIDSRGDYLDKLYGKDWILTNSRNESELGKKMIKFCQLILNEFFR